MRRIFLTTYITVYYSDSFCKEEAHTLKSAGLQHPPPMLGDKQQSLMNYLSHTLKAGEKRWDPHI